MCLIPNIIILFYYLLMFNAALSAKLPPTWWQLGVGVGGGSLRFGLEQNHQNCTKVSADYTASHAKLLVELNLW